MTGKIDRVAVEDDTRELKLSSRLGYGTIMPTLMTCVVVLVMWTMVTILLVPDEWQKLAVLAPLSLVASSCLLMSIVDRTRVTVTAAGVHWGTGPIPVPEYPSQRYLPVDQIAAVFVSPRAIATHYYASFFRSYEILLLTVEGTPERLLSRVRSLTSARELASLIEARLALPAKRTIPLLATDLRPVFDNPDLAPRGTPAGFFSIAAIIAGLLIVAAPWLRTIGKAEAAGTIVKHELEWVKPATRGYTKRWCIVAYDTPAGQFRGRLAEDCAPSSKVGDALTVYYDPEHPKRVTARGYWRSWCGLIFLLPGVAGLILEKIARRRLQAAQRVLAEDRFRSLNPLWDLTRTESKAGKGGLELNGPPGTTLSPLHRESAFASPTIEVQTRSRAGKSINQAAGIFFWADGLGHGYAFTVVPLQGGVDAWRLANGKWQRLLPLIRLPHVATTAGEWNTLRVVTEGAKAVMYVNGACAGSIEGEPPPGGSLAGLYAEFPQDTNASWEFTGFRVTATPSTVPAGE